MSYDIRLTAALTGETLRVPVYGVRAAGGTYLLGGPDTGTDELWLNITYNYAGIFGRIFADRGAVRGVRTLYGRTGAESIPILKAAIAQLDDNDNVSSNYWDAIEGNARFALVALLSFAEARPDGVWAGD